MLCLTTKVSLEHTSNVILRFMQERIKLLGSLHPLAMQDLALVSVVFGCLFLVWNYETANQGMRMQTLSMAEFVD